jgi:transposase
MPRGRHAVAKALPEVLARLTDRLPTVLIETLREQLLRIGQLNEQITELEQRLRVWHQQNEACRRIAEIPGVGLLTATAAVATMGDPKAFASGREFAAWLGLVPRQIGTGGRVKLLGISKRGNTYLRTLLIHGARSVLMHSKEPPEWATHLARRRPVNVAVVAMANKTARTLWALLAYERAYQPRSMH